MRTPIAACLAKYMEELHQATGTLQLLRLIDHVDKCSLNTGFTSSFGSMPTLSMFSSACVLASRCSPFRPTSSFSIGPGCQQESHPQVKDKISKHHRASCIKVSSADRTDFFSPPPISRIYVTACLTLRKTSARRLCAGIASNPWHPARTTTRRHSTATTSRQVLAFEYMQLRACSSILNLCNNVQLPCVIIETRSM